MKPYELRVYTLKSKQALDFYVNQIYPRHINSFAQYGIKPLGIWTVKDGDKPQAFVLASYAEGADPIAVVRKYMQSPEFSEEVKGWDPSNIVNVQSTFLEPTKSSPLN